MEDIVKNIVQEHIGEPNSIERLTTGICNEVYAVDVSGTGYIVRMNKDTTQLYGTSLFVPKLAPLGIRVPKIIAEEYDVSKYGYAYQILERLSGDDLGNVIESLNEKELKGIAVEVASIFKKLRTLPTNGTYGEVIDEQGGKFSNWQSWVENDLRTSETRAQSTGLFKRISHLLEPVRSTIKSYEPYFATATSVAYYGDIAGKNVLVDGGRFSGLVDLDALAYGDPLEAVGRIYASWYGTDYGKIYSNAVMEALELNDEQRKTVQLYALQHRFSWMCENGVAFNANTSGTIDEDKAKRDMEIVSRLLRELT